MLAHFLFLGAVFLPAVGCCAKMDGSIHAGPGTSKRTTETRTEVTQEVQDETPRDKNGSTKCPHQDGCKQTGELAAAAALDALGKRSLGDGDLFRAEEYYSQALIIQSKLAPNQLALAESLNGLGMVAGFRGQAPKAEGYFRQALAIFQKLNVRNLGVASSLHGLGRIALELGHFSEAERYLREALTLRQKLAPQGRETADSLNSMGDLYLLRGDLVNAFAFYRQALHMREGVAPDSLDLAESLSALGVIAFRRQDRAKAEKYQLQALAIREKYAPGSLPVANSFLRLAYCYSDDLPKAESLVAQALAIQKRLAPDSLVVAASLGILAQTAEIQGNLDRAEDYQSQALAIRERLAPGSLLFGLNLLQLGDTATYRGDLDKAEEYLGRALFIIEKRAPESSSLAASLTSLGTLAYRRHDLTKAEGYYRRSLVIRQKLDPNGPEVAISLRRLGQIARERGDLINARQLHQQALVIRKKVAPGSLEVANSLYDMGSVSRDEGELITAERYYHRALAIWRKIVPDSLYVAQGLGGLGTLAQVRREWADAHNYLNDALVIWQRIVPGSLDESWALSALGDVAQQRGDLVGAEAYYRQSLAVSEKLAPAGADHAQTLASLASILKNRQPENAEQFYEKSLGSIETQMSRLGGSEAIRSGFRAKYQSNYKNYLDLLIARNKPDAAFEVSERLRARSLLENLATAGADIRKGVDPVLLQQERSLESSITAKRERRIRLLNGKPTDEQLAAIDKEIEGLLKQKQDVAGEIRSTSPVYAALTQPRPLSAKEVQQQLLDAETALLEYSLGAEHSYVFVLSENSVAVFELPKNAEIEAVARPVYDILTARSQVRKSETEAQRMVRLRQTEAQYPDAANKLSRMILGPVAPFLGGKRLLIVSDGILQYVPFGALPAPREEASFVPLIADHEIVSLPSASVLQVLKQESASRPKPPREVAVLADPVFSAADERVRHTENTADAYLRTTQEAAKSSSFSRGLLLRSAAEVGVGNSASRFPRLFFSKREADAILQQSSMGKTELAVDFRASRATATSPELAQYRIIHFATHGLLNSEHPELSGLVLSLVDQRGRPQDGFLTLADIYNLNLQAEMVVLSACETGLGKEIKGEGLIGITRGFMYAGASRVVASLWKVDDAATAELMGKFYQGILKEGLQPAAALRKAQVEMWREKRWSFPYYWAGFLMQGQW
jgi:CHAT domain-containing protein/Tfp pilus assembly protein PilF